MKKKFSYKNIIFKGKRLAALCLFVVFGAGLAITSSMTGDIPVHDGDVLVDSLAVAEKEDKTGDKSSEGSFEEMRAALTLERNKLIDNSKNDAEKANASKSKEKIAEYMETELAIESLIKSKNLPESFVIITDSSVSITVDKQELDTNTVAKICDIAMRETGRSTDKIVIQSKF